MEPVPFAIQIIYFVKDIQRTWRDEMVVGVEKFPALIYKLFTLIFLGCAIDLVEIFFSYKIFKLYLHTNSPYKVSLLIIRMIDKLPYLITCTIHLHKLRTTKVY